MFAQDNPIVGSLVKSLAVGAMGGVIFAAAVLTLDVAGIGTMVSSASAKALMLTAVLGGSATKGATFGFVFAVATLGWKERAPRPAFTPVLATKS